MADHVYPPLDPNMKAYLDGHLQQMNQAMEFDKKQREEEYTRREAEYAAQREAEYTQREAAFAARTHAQHEEQIRTVSTAYEQRIADIEARMGVMCAPPRMSATMLD
jgi:hypothetical protein